MAGMMDSPGNPNPNYYQNVDYGNYQPYNVAGTVFGTPTGPYPTTTNVAQGQGNPPPTGTNTAEPGGLFHPPNWLEQPQDATVRAMRQAGYNPASFNPLNQQILRNANNFQASLFGQMAGPGGDISNFTNDQAMLDKLQAMIQQGAAGGKVFGGYDPASMANFSKYVAQSEAGSTDPNVQNLAKYLWDPSRALSLSQSLLYSGLAPQFQQAAAAPLANLSDYYQRLMETGQQYGRTIIDVLLGAPVYGHPAGSQGVPLPFQASAWRYQP